MVGGFKSIFGVAIVLTLTLGAPKSAFAFGGGHHGVPNENGPYNTTSSEYRFPAQVDSEVLAQNDTNGNPLPIELWARVYRPTHLGNFRHSLIVLLHGNHATCGFGSNPIQTDQET